jgi:hypothetical protein
MKSLNALLSQPLTWSFKKRTIVLKSNNKAILELKELKPSKASFDFRGKKYVIRTEGFWNPKLLVEKEGKQILSLNREFLGGNATIKFTTGNLYYCTVKNDPLVKLSFFTEKEQEVLHYGLEAASRPKTILTITNTQIPANELLMLILLGCYSFKGIFIEHDATGVISIESAGL